MRLRSTIWLHVYFCVMISGAAENIWAASNANAGGDVPAVRTPNTPVPHVDGEALLRDEAVILEHAREVNEDVYSSLQAFVCDEEIDRYRGNFHEQTAHLLDTVTAKLSFERGVEEYSNIRQNNRPRTSLSSLPGAWSEGEFGTLLLQTQQLLATQKVEFDTYADEQGEAAAIYRFDVSDFDSPWDLAVAGRHYKVAFHTSVWISVKTGEILRIDRSSLNLNPETRISEIQWQITLKRFNLSGKDWLLPASGTYSVLYNETQHREWNLIAFSGYQRYSSQASVKFE